MARRSKLDEQWSNLMSLCAQEKTYATTHRHFKLRGFLDESIVQLAREMGFTEQQIKTREFRAEKSGERVIRIITE